MDDQNNNQPVTDDADLANALADINQGQAGAQAPSDGLQFEEAPLPQPEATPGVIEQPPVGETEPPAFAEAPIETPTPEIPSVEVPAPEATPYVPPAVDPTPVVPEPQKGPLDSIKQSALNDLRPLIGKLALPPDERFDTLLLIIRSTDDQSLINDAYEAARTIEDETKRAQALLDVIKEIDYFSQQQK